MKIQSNQKTKYKMAAVSTHISKITLNVNGLNLTIKTNIVATWIKKKLTIRCLHKIHFSFKEKHKLKECMMILQENGIKRRAKCGSTHIRQKQISRQKMVTRGKDGHFIIINEGDIQLIYRGGQKYVYSYIALIIHNK